MEEQGQPEPVELVWDLGVEKGQQPAHLVQAVHLGASMGVSARGLAGLEARVWWAEPMPP